MNANDFIAEMRKALHDERDAIRRLDVKGVTAAGIAKEQILKSVTSALHGGPPEDRQALATALQELKGELRRNLILLAHARDYLSDAITLCTQQKPGRPRLQASL